MLGVAPVTVQAQAEPAFQLSTPKAQPESEAVLKGRSSFDLVRLRDGSISIALRYGNVIDRTETVVLNGRTLSRERDYAIDYANGLIYLKVAYRDGQTLNVSYRYDDTKATTGIFGSATSGTQNAFSFQLTPGASAMLGLGYTERLSDGSVIRGNLFGMASSLKFGGGGTFAGVMLMNEREKSDIANVLGEDRQDAELEEGQGKAIVQDLSVHALGGKLSVSYQDIDDRFAGFSSFAGAGYTADQIKMFQGEKGLKRVGFNLSGAQAGALTFGGGMRSVGDGTGTVQWRSADAKIAGISVDWNSQVVDPGFNKFQGLREKDAQQLRKERGLARESLNLGYKSKGLESGFSLTSVKKMDDEQGLWRSQLSVKSGWLTAGWMRQSIDEDFNRFGDLRDGDRGQLAKERGMDRNNYTLGVASKWLKADYTSMALIDDSGEFKGTDILLGYGGWSLAQFTRSISDGFRAQGALTGEDRQKFMDGVAGMYESGAKATGKDQGGINAAGIDRTGTRLSGSFGDFKALWNQVVIDNESGTMRLNNYSLNRGKTSVKLSFLDSSDGFSGIRHLTHSEQQRLGTVDGLDKIDFDLNAELGKGGSLSANIMNADSPEGGANRHRLEAKYQGLEFSYNRRGVDEAFRRVGQISDPEHELFAALIGFDQSEVIANYSPNSSMQFGYRDTQAFNSLFDQLIKFSQFSANLALTTQTSLGYESVKQSNASEGLVLIDSKYTSLSLMHDFGRGNKIMLRNEKHEFAGSEQTAPNAEKRTVAVETQLNPTTQFRTEQSETKFDDGTRETESRNKISTALNKRLGVSVEDQQVRRDGDLPDEVRRNYGFWIDFGSGVRLDYGYNRNIEGPDRGTMNTNVGLSGGKFAGLDFGGATYQTNRWDNQRQNYFGNVRFANATAFDLGFFKGIKFNYSTDTQRDFLKWQKELITMGVSGKMFGAGIGWNYSSQVDQNGVRAIDRTFDLKLGEKGKSPFSAALKYGVRTMPNDDSIFIRDYSVAFQANKFLSIEHALVTNPLQGRGGVLLGTVPLDERKSSWTAKYQNDPELKFDLGWNEIKRDHRGDELRREARFNATLFADNPSPVQLTYSLQQWHRNSQTSLAHSYGISFFQQPGPNQSMSFSLEHLQWGQGRPDNNPFLRDWKLRFDYSLRF